MAKVNNWHLFQLLLWKNFKLRLNQKRKLLWEFLFPILILLILIYTRLKVHIEVISAGKQPPTSISGGKTMENVIYTPDNAILKSIMTEAFPGKPPKGFATLDELNNAYVGNANFSADLNAVVQFDPTLANITAFPDKLRFGLLLPVSEFWNTKSLYFRLNHRGRPDSYENRYSESGFLNAQSKISMAFLKLVSGKKTLPKLVLNAFPYPKHEEDHFFVFARVICIALVMSGLHPATMTMNRIVLEKERQLKVVMKIMGMNNCLQWLAWFVDYMAIQIVLILLTLIAFKVAFADIPIFPKTSWSVLLVFLLLGSISCISFHFMLSSLFQTVRTAMAVQTFLILILTGFPIIFKVLAPNLGMRMDIAFCFLCIPAVIFGYIMIIQYECTEIGLSWSNIFIPPTPDIGMSLGIMLVLMIVSSLLYIIICLYVEQIYPGSYDVPRPFYFPITRDFWRGPKQTSSINVIDDEKIPDSNRDAFEPERTVGKTVGVQLTNLRKKFGKNEVVKGLTMNMYKDEVTVLLGHNGAGKTTSISMIAGMIPPTSGTAIVNGFDVRKDIQKVRQSLGVCPQHNVLFDKLTVEDHLRFFCRLKGLEGRELEDESDHYLKILNLRSKSTAMAETLSGGMKRKLSVCCAMCGGSTVVLCDEPSAGMDPASRRELWNLIISQKKGRTILLTTHLMDEADILGDKISIMADGVLKCQGSSFFLKKKYGTGYQLVCTKAEGCNETEVTNLLSNYVPNLIPESDIRSEIIYNLSENYSPIFKNMLHDLEQNLSALLLTGFGVNITSLEDVFMKVGSEQLSAVDQSSLRNHDFSPLEIQRKQQNSGSALFFNRVWAMQLKNMSYNYYKKTLLCMQFIIPVFIALVPLYAGSPKESKMEFTPIHLNTYSNAVAVLETTSDVVANSLEDLISKQYKNVVTSDGGKFESTGGQILSKFLNEKDQLNVNFHYIVGATIEAKKITAWYSLFAQHSQPATLNMIYNAMARAFIGEASGIEIMNKPLQIARTIQMKDDHQNIHQSLNALLNTMAIIMYIRLALLIFLSYFILFPIMERRMRTKLLFYISGTSSWLFWITHWLWDTFIFTIFMLIISLCYGLVKEGSFSTFAEERHFLLMFYIYGVTIIPVIYALSYLFNEDTIGFTSCFMGLQIAHTGALIVASFSKPRNMLCIFHPYAFEMALQRIIPKIAMDAAMCLTAKPPKSCGKLYPFFQFTELGVFKEVLFMTGAGITCMLLIILSDIGMFDYIEKFISKRKRSPKVITTDCYCDDDVTNERLAIKKMPVADRQKYNLLTDGLSKAYDACVTVNKLSFAVPEYECFGLLGVNGAGKTTTFKMLTGETIISSGNAYVRGVSLKRNMSRACQEIGYCPQFDAVPDYLSGRLTLRIFCILHGIPRLKINKYITDLANSFGFTEHLDKQICNYSGGNKRKLSAAVAIIGCPSLIYLDEPTAGIDPAARRMLWDNMFRMRDSGKSIILTSHSMEECEALCTRLAIMIGGVLRCLGSIQHLKNKFSKGMVLKIKVDLNAQGYQNDQHKVAVIKDFMIQFFDQAKLHEEYQGLLTYYLPTNDYKWSVIFGIMEDNRSKLPLEDYSVSQTTIEEIFLAFNETKDLPANHVCTCPY